MRKLRLCFEIDGLGIDEKGDPCPAVLEISFGEIDKELKYEDFVKSVNIQGLLEILIPDGLQEQIKSENARIISPEEYDQKYGDNASET